MRLNNRIRILQLPPRRAESIITALLILAKPRLPRLSQHAFCSVVDEMPAHDQHKCHGIHPMNVQMEHLYSHNHTPKVSRQETDIEEGRGSHAEDHRRGGVEPRKNERIPNQVASNFTIPGGDLEGVSVEDGGLDAVDEHTPEGELADDFVHGALADEELFEDVREAVACRTHQRKEVAFDGIDGLAAVRACDVVGSYQHTQSAAADQDAGVLGDVVADLEENERDDDHDRDGPEVDQLCRQDSCVPVRQDGKVVSLDIAEGEDEIAPAVGPEQAQPSLEAVLVYRCRRVNEVQQYIVEKTLKRRDGGTLAREKRRKRVGAGYGDGQRLG